MIESIISMELPAGGHLAIRRNRICPEQETKQCRRISLVSGIHGDELEGQYICYETARRVKEHPEYLKGIVDHLSGIESVRDRYGEPHGAETGDGHEPHVPGRCFGGYDGADHCSSGGFHYWIGYLHGSACQ